MKEKAVAGATAGGAFGLVATTATMYFFTVPKHPQAVFGLMVGSVVVFIVSSTFWFFMRDSDKKNEQSVPFRVSKISGDNTGAQLNAGHDIINHYNYAPGTHSPAAPELALSDMPQTTTREGAETLPILQFSRRTEQVIFDPMRSHWRLAHAYEVDSVSALVLWVENHFPMQGSGSAYSLIANIRAQQFDSVTVARGYWTGQTFNEVALAPGAELGIIVGHFEGGSFKVYDNPHAPPLGYSIVDDGFRPRGHEANLDLIIVRDRENTPLIITVKIAQMPGHFVIACKNIIVTLPQLIVDMRDCDDPRGPRRAC